MRLYTAIFFASITCIWSLRGYADFPTGDADFDSLLKQSYSFAIRDSEKLGVQSVRYDLTPIVKTNEKIIWRTRNGGEEVLVVSLREKFDDAVSDKKKLLEDYWVTVAPEVLHYYSSHRSEFRDPEIRLKQLLGLNPETIYKRVVEFWVRPSDLIRPSPDPGIGDTVSDANFDESDNSEANKKHIEWFAKTKEDTKGKWPWTRGGYTYDWGKLYDHFGLSEFVIKAGAGVEVAGVYTIKEYLSKAQ